MASPDLVYRWRKSSRSGHNGSCVELGLAWRKSSLSGEAGGCVELGWRKSSSSGETGHCVELADACAVRDSKNPDGPMLRVDLGDLLTAAKAGSLDR